MSALESLSPRAWLALILLWFVASILLRRWMHKPLFARAAPDARFVERWASCRSGGGLMGRLSTAKNCVQVQVTGSHLLVAPHFPISLGFVPEVYDMDKRIALADLRAARRVGGWRAQAIEVHYRRTSGHTGDLTSGRPALLMLLLRRGDDFLQTLGLPTEPPPAPALPSPARHG